MKVNIKIQQEETEDDSQTEILPKDLVGLDVTAETLQKLRSMLGPYKGYITLRIHSISGEDDNKTAILQQELLSRMNIKAEPGIRIEDKCNLYLELYNSFINILVSRHTGYFEMVFYVDIDEETNTLILDISGAEPWDA